MTPEQGKQSIAAWANEVKQRSAPVQEAEKAAAPVREPDGYLRQTPVQPIRDCPGYRMKMLRRTVLWVLVAAAAVTAYYLIVSGIVRL